MPVIRQTAYLVLAIGSAALAWRHGAAWIADWIAAGGNVLNLPGMFFDFMGAGYAGNEAAAFLTVDLAGSWYAFMVFVLPEAERLGMRYGWGYVAASCVIGNCFAFPLFLFNRERAMARVSM